MSDVLKERIQDWWRTLAWPRLLHLDCAEQVGKVAKLEYCSYHGIFNNKSTSSPESLRQNMRWRGARQWLWESGEGEGWRRRYSLSQGNVWCVAWRRARMLCFMTWLGWAESLLAQTVQLQLRRSLGLPLLRRNEFQFLSDDASTYNKADAEFRLSEHNHSDLYSRQNNSNTLCLVL